MENFGEQVQRAVEVYEKRLRAVAKTSVQETVQIASTTVGDGGRMRVKTGFLWHSVAANIGAMPAGTSSPVEPNMEYTFTGADIAATLIKWDLTEPMYVGWIANYARPREHFDGFVKGAVERWQDTVNKVSRRAEKRMGLT